MKRITITGTISQDELITQLNTLDKNDLVQIGNKLLKCYSWLEYLNGKKYERLTPKW
jgi:hypothetical protein